MRYGLATAGAGAPMLLAFLLAPFLPGEGPAHAHHSFAMFDMAKEVTVNGTVKQFQWANPHAYIQIVAQDASGRDVEWSLEMGAPMYLYARGWRPNSLKAGMRISVTLNPLRNGKPGGVVREVASADGQPIGKNT